MWSFKKNIYRTAILDECQDCISHDVIIGTQTWTGCNLNVSTYRNGDTIPEIQDQTLWTNATTGAWCYYNNDPSTEATYGKLYNVYALLDPRGIGPIGYHVPTDAEWTALTNYLGGLTVAGGKLKEEGLCHWITPNSGATNTSSFAAFGAGTRSANGFFAYFNEQGTFWSTTESTPVGGNYYVRNLNTNSATTNVYDFAPTNGLSVRLVKTVPFDIEVSSSCSGGGALASMNIVLGTGVEPYYSAIAVFNSEAAALANTTWSLGTNSVAVGVDPAIVATYWLVAKDSEDTIVTKSVNINCTPPAALNFSLSQTCSGSDVTLVANTITGGTGPYQISTGTFANQLDAEANTSWVTATTRNFALGNVAGEYWVAVKDSTGDILAKDIYADCWSISADRELGYRSTLGNTSSSTTCGYPAEVGTNNLYVAVHTPNTLAVGDRVFLSDLPGTAVFDGTSGIPNTPKYWKLGLNTEFSPCTGDGTAARINEYGVIEDLICCP